MFERLLKNTGSNVLVLLVKIAITLIMTPMYVHALGNYDYGIWEIVCSIIGYMGLLDMGMIPTITRFVAKFNAENNRDGLKRLYSTSLFFMGLVGIVVGVIFVIWAVSFPELLAEGGSKESRYAIFLLIIAGQLLLTFPGYVAESFFQGEQKYSLINNITIVNSVVGSAIVYAFIDESNALLLLAAVNAIGIVCKYVIYFMLLSRPKHGSYSLSVVPDVGLLKELLIFGSKSLIQGIGHRVEAGSAPMVIGSVLGPAYVVFFVIPSSLARYLQVFGWAIVQAFLPVFSDLHGRNDKALTQEVYVVYSRYVLLVLIPLAIGAYTVGGDFIRLWMGQEYAEVGGLILKIMVVYYMLPFINPFSSRYLTAVGKHGFLAKLYPVVAVFNLAASIVLVNYIGVSGAAVGALVPLIVSVPHILKYVCNDLDINVRDYIKKVLLPFVAPTIVMVVGLYWARNVYGIYSYFDIVVLGGAATTVYLGMCYFWVLDQEERRSIKVSIQRRMSE